MGRYQPNSFGLYDMHSNVSECGGGLLERQLCWRPDKWSRLDARGLRPARGSGRFLGRRPDVPAFRVPFQGPPARTAADFIGFRLAQDK